MYKAYDTILQTEVSVESAVQNGDIEQYRYECACCGEAVYVAAPYSTLKSAHFRHRSGNNDVECEIYLGHSNTLTIGNNGRHSNRERIEFYYSNETKLFYIGIRFSAIDIIKYEEKNAILKISTSSSNEPFFEIPISNRYFIPDYCYKVPLDELSLNYFIWNTIDNEKRPYKFINKRNGLAFFKLSGSGINEYEAKFVRGCLFTRIRYLAVTQSRYITPKDFNLPSEILVEKTFRFKSMNHNFLGKILCFSSKTPSIEEICHSWGYRIEDSESLSVLWPPVSIENDICITSNNNVFLQTSFALQSHGNINTHPKAFEEIAYKLYKVALESQIRIYKKNMEITIQKKGKTKSNYKTLNYSEYTNNVFKTPKEGNHFWFGTEGVMLLKEGQEIVLLGESSVKSYLSTYLFKKVLPHKLPLLIGEELLKDCLLHYKYEESFDPECFNGYTLSNVACRYITMCQSLGKINSIVKQYILEGVL